ncbi:MoaD/ThiS family protein [Pedobacter cryophilus]|uniref:MoaD/ThiS family protein n=1 Tax=Pedobacter cryophilus TaxID=2571271 RepID=A0A4U1C326_9SPHI|nr:MoaD/ThiS family protein [Pedobacter cryophilus]TKB97594.1 MoaD/ThiS family protein [Pedobacter cryophilus]
MKVKVYAVLKDYFAAETEIVAQNITDLKEQLLQLNPSAKEVINLSRFAVNDAFVENNHQINENDTISIIPPSSGG